MPKKIGPMWIKWRYCDHGHSQEFKELEIPSGFAPVEYLEHQDLVPHWGERYMDGRIKWKQIKQPSKATLRREIESLKEGIASRIRKLKQLTTKLNARR